MAALFRWAACHREGRKRSGRGKNRIILSSRFVCLQTTFRRASRRADTHTLLLATSYFRDTVDILGRLILGQSTRYQVFLWIIFSSLSGRRDDGRAGGGWKLGGGGGGEGGDTQLDGRTDGRWADGFYGGTSVVHILFLCPVFLRVLFAESEREREREREGYPVAANSCQLQRRRLHAYNPPPPSPTHTHTHYLLEFERERPYLLLPTCLTSTLHQSSSRTFCLLSF